MRRLYAFILLIPLAAFFVEAVKIPVMCGNAPVSKCSLMNKMHGKCMKAMNHQTKKEKSNSKSCIECPVCYLATFPSVPNFGLFKPFKKMEYSVMLVNNLSGYIAQHWKPPNAFLL